MPVASPFLDSLLTRWIDQQKQVRENNSLQIDELLSFRLMLDDQWTASGDQRRDDFSELEKTRHAADASWAERLRRPEEWLERLTGQKRAQERLAQTLSTHDWFEKMESVTEHFGRTAVSRADRFAATADAFDQQLEAWLTVLTERETELCDLQAAARAAENPLFVSRSRKQQEIDFLALQAAIEMSLLSQIQSLRRAVSHWLGRSYKISRELETRARIDEGFLEFRRNQLQDDLKEPQNRFFALREKVLSEALIFEACRHKIRRMNEAAKSLRCLEDAYPAPATGFKKWFA